MTMLAVCQPQRYPEVVRRLSRPGTQVAEHLPWRKTRRERSRFHCSVISVWQIKLAQRNTHVRCRHAIRTLPLPGLQTRTGPRQRNRRRPDQARQHNQDLCFSSRPFVLCGLPVRRLSKNRRTSSFTRGGMGSSSFRSGHPEVGVPFGQDRPVPIFLATVAVQQKTQDQVRHSCGDVGELWNSSGRRGVPVAYGCLRTDLRRDHILRR